VVYVLPDRDSVDKVFGSYDVLTRRPS
jgi:hypothetical protein